MTREETNYDLLKAQKGIRHDVDIAKDLGIKQANFSASLRGSLSMRTIETLAKYFGVTVKDFIK
jgi:hypothetical protein